MTIKQKHMYVLVALVLVLASLHGAATPVVAGEEDACGIDARAIGRDVEALLRAPGDWESGHWAAAGAVSAVTAGLIVGGDQAIYRRSVEAPNSFPYVIVHKLAWLGSWYGHNDLVPVITFGAVTGGFAIAGAARDEDRLTRTAGILTEAYLITAGATIALKFLTGRSRPHTGENPRRWRFLGIHRREFRSFPSGHTSSAFSMATVISKRHDDWYARVPAWTMAAAVAAQRIDSGAHWASDTLVGAALAYSISALLTDRHTCDGDGAASQSTPFLTVGFDF